MPPAPRSSIRDVAARAHVSVGTVSNVLNRPDLVAPATRDRVGEAIAALRFVPNGSARQLRAGSSPLVGTVVIDLANPFFTEVARGVEDRLDEDDCLAVMCSSDEKPEKEQRALRMLVERGVRGLIVAPATDDVSFLDELAERDVPVVLLDRTSPSPEVSSVAVDDVRGGELAATHLFAQGHRRLGFINGEPAIRQCADRRSGVRRAVRSAGLSVRDLAEVTVGTLTADGGAAGMTQLLDLPVPPTAVICVNDLVALGALRVLRDRGLRVPADVAVVGYDDVQFASMLTVPLTSIRQPKYQMGREAASLLLAASDRNRHEQPVAATQQIVFQPELVVRASSITP